VAYALEIERNRGIAAESGVVAATVGVDTAAWRLTRVVVREANERAAQDAVTYEVLHLARPLLDPLPRGS